MSSQEKNLGINFLEKMHAFLAYHEKEIFSKEDEEKRLGEWLRNNELMVPFLTLLDPTFEENNKVINNFKIFISEAMINSACVIVREKINLTDNLKRFIKSVIDTYVCILVQLDLSKAQLNIDTLLLHFAKSPIVLHSVIFEEFLKDCVALRNLKDSSVQEMLFEKYMGIAQKTREKLTKN